MLLPSVASFATLHETSTADHFRRDAQSSASFSGKRGTESEYSSSRHHHHRRLSITKQSSVQQSQALSSTTLPTSTKHRKSIRTQSPSAITSLVFRPKCTARLIIRLLARGGSQVVISAIVNKLHYIYGTQTDWRPTCICVQNKIDENYIRYQSRHDNAMQTYHIDANII